MSDPNLPFPNRPLWGNAVAALLVIAAFIWWIGSNDKQSKPTNVQSPPQTTASQDDQKPVAEPVPEVPDEVDKICLQTAKENWSLLRMKTDDPSRESGHQWVYYHCVSVDNSLDDKTKAYYTSLAEQAERKFAETCTSSTPGCDNVRDHVQRALKAEARGKKLITLSEAKEFCQRNVENSTYRWIKVSPDLPKFDGYRMLYYQCLGDIEDLDRDTRDLYKRMSKDAEHELELQVIRESMKGPQTQWNR